MTVVTLVVMVEEEVVVVIEEVWVVALGEAEVVDVVKVVGVAELVVQFMPSDNSRTSLPFNPQPTAHSRSACVSDMSYTAAPAKGRDKRGGSWTKENRATPCALHSCIQTSVPQYNFNTASSVSGSG